MLRVALIWLMLALPACAQPLRIVMFGDSLTEGYGLPPEQGLVPVLQDWLAERGYEVELINHGLSGDTTFGGRVRIDWALRGGADAVVVELGANDMMMGLPAERAESNLDVILREAGKHGPVLLVGIDAPGRIAPERRSAWRAIWPRLAIRNDALLLPDLYAPLHRLKGRARRDAAQSDGLHPSAEGVRRIVEMLGPEMIKLVQEVRK